MKAEAHLEVYRRFQGRLEERRWRFWPILGSGLRTALKQRKALLFLYGPIAIATIVFSVIVYFAFVFDSQREVEAPRELSLETLVMQGVQAQIEKLLEVVTWIIEFNKAMGFAATLAVAWFASGLLCEDRKAGAHQLYFARPITRLDYVLGKFSIAAFFSLCAMLVPMLVICVVAAFSSPEWSFLTHQWDVIFRALGFSLTWTAVLATLVLLASSLAPRRSFAMIGAFAVTLITEAASGILGEFVDRRFIAIGIVNDLNALCYWFFDKPVDGPPVTPGLAWAAVLATLVLSWLVIGARLRRLEVVA